MNFWLIILALAVTAMFRTCIDNHLSGSMIKQNMNYEMDANEPLMFHGYNCLEDCSGHEAGYN